MAFGGEESGSMSIRAGESGANRGSFQANPSGGDAQQARGESDVGPPQASGR